MARWIALLRGINVGGRNIIPMKALVGIFENAGSSGVRTYIQSGNVVFDASIPSRQRFAKDVADRIEEQFGFRPAVLLLAANELGKAIDVNPYPEAASEPKSLHLSFLADKPDIARLEGLAGFASGTERFTVVGNVLYLHAPDGVGRSKLVSQIDSALGKNLTARNWRTVTKLSEMAAGD